MMKPEFDSTIDSLLRQHGRRAQTRAADTAQAVAAGPHLDADEMNAYAENALPTATRTRYMAHLADCTACRQIVTQLALAANPEFATVAETVSAPASTETVPAITEVAPVRSWRDRLAAWFAPSAAWRYAVPALAVAVLSVSAFLALRSNRAINSAPETQSVARNEGNPTTVAPSAPATPTNSNNAMPAASVEPSQVKTNGGDNSNTRAGKEKPSLPLATAPTNSATPEREADVRDLSAEIERARKSGQFSLEKAGRDTPAEATNITNNENAPAIVSAPSGGAGTTATGGAGVAKPASPAPALRSASATPPRATISQPNDADERQREEKRNTETSVAGLASGASARRITPKPAPPTVAPVPKKPRQDGASADDAENKKDQTDEGKQKKNEARVAETRTVSGRTFAKRGSVWIDQSCAKGCHPRTLSRSSDEYKKGDAELRAIVDQLGGTVIIVWRGQALRVQ